jgi:hypothetical protein
VLPHLASACVTLRQLQLLRVAAADAESTAEPICGMHRNPTGSMLRAVVRSISRSLSRDLRK